MPEVPASHSQRLKAARAAGGTAAWAGRDPRKSAARRGYGRRWRAVSLAWIRKHPQCVRCGRLVTAADLAELARDEAAGRRDDTAGARDGQAGRRAARRRRPFVCDHIVPHKGDQRLFWDPENRQTLCEHCHNRKTALEDGGFGRAVLAEAIIAQRDLYSDGENVPRGRLNLGGQVVDFGGQITTEAPRARS